MRCHNLDIIPKIVFIAIYVILIGTVSTACRSHQGMALEKEEGMAMAFLNKEFVLAIGQGAIFQEEDLLIRFIAVMKDSRCPKGVKCMWEGDVEILVEIGKSGEIPISFTLHTSKRFKRVETYLHYKIQIITLAPYPQKDVELEPEMYTLTLVVNKG